jgi:hypothetical protein
MQLETEIGDMLDAAVGGYSGRFVRIVTTVVERSLSWMSEEKLKAASQGLRGVITIVGRGRWRKSEEKG